MKINVSWYDDINDVIHECISQNDFDMPAEAFIEKLDTLITTLELKHGVCIDQGGDNNFYELNLADIDSSNHNKNDELAKEILDASEKEMSI